MNDLIHIDHVWKPLLGIYKRHFLRRIKRMKRHQRRIHRDIAKLQSEFDDGEFDTLRKINRGRKRLLKIERRQGYVNLEVQRLKTALAPRPKPPSKKRKEDFWLFE